MVWSLSIYRCVLVVTLGMFVFPYFDNTQTWEPDASEVVASFQCTEDLTGRLFPTPGGGGLYVLDFVDKTNRRVPDPGLEVYAGGYFGYTDRDIVYHVPCATPGVSTGVFVFNPAGATIEVTPQDNPDEVLKTIGFTCTRGVHKPFVC